MLDIDVRSALFWTLATIAIVLPLIAIFRRLK
jgi:hypothetical protein